MRKTTAAFAALTALGASLTVVAEAQAAPGASESFVMTFQTIGGVDQPTRVAATGPITGAGIETETWPDPNGNTVDFTWHLQNGTVTAEAVEDFSITFDLTACTAKATGIGTWRITGGTDAYAGATGTGTFADHGSYAGTRDAHGACDFGAEPKTAIFTLRGQGTATLS